MLDELRDLYAYNRWANQVIFGAAAALPPVDFARDLGSSFPSVGATVAHMIGAEWVWLERWRGRSPTAFLDLDAASAEALIDRWKRQDTEQAAFLAGLTEDAVLARISYRTFAGVQFEAPLWELMRHVVNHASYHRGQIVTLLRQLGSAAPSTDLILYYRNRPLAEPPLPS